MKNEIINWKFLLNNTAVVFAHDMIFNDNLEAAITIVKFLISSLQFP